MNQLRLSNRSFLEPISVSDSTDAHWRSDARAIPYGSRESSEIFLGILVDSFLVEVEAR